LILFLSYRIGLSRAIFLSVFVSIFVVIKEARLFPYETILFLLFTNAVPIIAASFKKDLNNYKETMRVRFEEVKGAYGELVRKDKYEIESNIEREKRLQQVLSLYEISKDMSSCLTFEDIFDIFSSTLKKSFRFRLSRLVLLKESNELEAVYQIELGSRVNKAIPDDFDRELAKIGLETRAAFSVSPQENSNFLRRLSIIKDFETLVSVPLFSEERLVGILYIENIPRLYFENFIILTGQFAIQLQKVFLYKKVEVLSVTDSITEVSTRRYFLERFLEETRRSMRHKTNFSLLMLDLDHFKETNDRFGHLVGDVILKEVARILKSNLREIDIIGRYGGEEFAIVLAGTPRSSGHQVAERIRENIERAIFKAYDEVVSTTVSIGVSVFPDDGPDIDSLIEAADKALYKAKETGRNRVC
jgi:diguanylate cyclase (GGDEF)-like protein